VLEVSPIENASTALRAGRKSGLAGRFVGGKVAELADKARSRTVLFSISFRSNFRAYSSMYIFLNSNLNASGHYPEPHTHHLLHAQVETVARGIAEKERG
jgi:hypothetical protein